ncbi:MAG: glycosyltransferase family 39 protein [Planctomycetes bacterium]|nr:glycosyltransferase family 39 protein [Planctomycetota bacterium]
MGPDGTRYSFFGLGQSVCMAPFVVAGHIAADVLPGGASPDQVGQFLTSIVFFPLCGALAVVLLYSIVLDLTRERRPARWVSILFGVATMHWHCAINTYEASQVAVCLLTCMWASQRAWSRDGLRYPLLAMTAAGIAFFFRISSVVLTGPLLLAVMGADILPRPQVGTRMRRLLRWIGAGLLGVAPFVILVMILNTVRFGHPLTTGYADLVGEWVFNTVTGERVKVQDTPLFEAPLREGLGGLLFSPGKSVFLYNPILLATIPGLILLWRTSRRMTVAVIAMLLTTLLFHGKYLFWTGDWAWGPGTSPRCSRRGCLRSSRSCAGVSPAARWSPSPS